MKQDGLRTLKEIGDNRQDVLATILPRLIDSQVRKLVTKRSRGGKGTF